MRTLPNDDPIAAEAEWSELVSALPDSARRTLTDPVSGREASYRALFVSRRATFGAIMLELLTLAESA